MNDDSIARISATPHPPEAATIAKRKIPALGRGLGALMGESRREEPLVSSAPGGGAPSGLAQLAVAAIEAHPDQPRRRFDEAALEELATSIATRGVIQPIIVRPLGQGRYQLVAGERRWRAAQRAQLHEIPALVRDLSDGDVTALALIENLQREDLNPVEEARAYQRLADSQGMTQTEIGRLVDKSRSHVANLQRLLALPVEVLDLVEEGKLAMGHARALIGAENAALIARAAIDRRMSVREVENVVRMKHRGDSPPRRARESRKGPEDADISAVQTHLEEFLGLAVRIKADADPRSGMVTIRYTTLDQLDLVCQRLTGGGI